MEKIAFMVAEKPSVAKQIAQILAKDVSKFTSHSKFNPIYEFNY